MNVEFRRASPEDARLLAETRRRAWDTTYRGIYPDAMIDEYDLEAHTARDAARIADPANAVFLAMDGAECVGYFTYGPYTYGRYKDFALCLNSLYFLPGYRRMGLGRRAFAQLTEFCRERGIHMDSNFTPMYNSAYVKGIANLYEFDVGSQSGWMYKVNGWFPNYGCSRYTVQQGDEICWMYTCVGYGEDIGGGYAMGG